MAKLENEKYFIYNPLNKDIESLPIIYGFNNGGREGFYHGQLISEDGIALGSHLCSDEKFMKSDLGILEDTGLKRHEIFKRYYPDGYRMDFVSLDEVSGHGGLSRAVNLNYQTGGLGLKNADKELMNIMEAK